MLKSQYFAILACGVHLFWNGSMRFHLMTRLLVLILVALPGYDAVAWLPVPFQITGPQYEPRLPFGATDVDGDEYDEVLVDRLLFFKRS